jgi:flagellar basal-body rod protein FlgG
MKNSKVRLVHTFVCFLLGWGAFCPALGSLNDLVQTHLKPEGTQIELTISGPGFFQLEMPYDGELAYTRDGVFFIIDQDRTCTLRSRDGERLVSPDIKIPDNTLSVAIDSDGTVFARLAGQVQPQNLGPLNLVLFYNPDGLERIGYKYNTVTVKATYWSGNPIIGTPGLDGLGTILQNHYAEPSLDVVERHFDMAVKAEKTAEEMLQILENIGL